VGLLTYRNKSKVSNFFLNIPHNLITSPGQKCSRARTHSTCRKKYVKMGFAILAIETMQKQPFSISEDTLTEKDRKYSYLLSLLFPVSLSTTVDLCILGFAMSIRYSHSSLVYSDYSAKL
jgi:hypothetical protein